MLLAAGLLSGCGAATQSTRLDTRPGAYPAALQGKLAGACSAAVATASGSFPTGYCECAIHTMEAQLPASEASGPAYVIGETMISDPDIRAACRH